MLSPSYEVELTAMGTICQHGKETERYVGSGKCKQCCRERMRDYSRRNKERLRENYRSIPHAMREARKESLYHYYLKRTYGITPQQFNAMLSAQGSRCAVCRSDDPGSVKHRWHVDHCHDTGIVRGILCMHCNVMIGMAREDARILEAGLRYLRGSDATH